MVRNFSIRVHARSRFFLLCVMSLFFLKHGYCSTAVQAVENEYSVTASRSRSENFFSRDDGLQSRLQDFLDVKTYSFSGLRGHEAKASAVDIVDSLMSWSYPELSRTLQRGQVLTRVLQDFRGCYEFYSQDRTRNENILRLLAPFCAVKKILGK